MNATRWLLILVLLALLVAAGWWFFGTRKADGSGGNGLKPHLSLATVNITDIDPGRIKMTARMFLSNPLPFEFKSNRLDYQLLIDSVKVLESSYSKPITVRSSDSASIELPIEVLTEQLSRVLKRFEANKTDSANYTLQATVYADVPIAGERQFNFDQTKRLPTVRLPKIKLEKVDVGKLGLKESTLKAVITVSNPNRFPFKFSNARYTAKVGEDLNVNGQIPGLTNVPARGSAPVTIEMDTRTGNIGRLAWKALFDKKDVPFRVNFRAKLVTDNDLLKNSNMAFNVNGTLEELKK
ncbi:MAG: LEA type 2 family protein [Cytophagaceae bacterium]|nr:LEA type 2 family protein [Cytophagaceae bacterium]